MSVAKNKFSLNECEQDNFKIMGGKSEKYRRILHSDGLTSVFHSNLRKPKLRIINDVLSIR